MPRVHFVKKARKKNPVADVGEPYYWWKFRYGPKRYSKTRPMPWQLTQSSFLQGLYQLQYEMASLESLDRDTAEEFIEQLDQLREECEDSLYNMPDALQDSSESGMLLQERIDRLEGWSEAISNLDFSDPKRALEEAIDADPGVE